MHRWHSFSQEWIEDPGAVFVTPRRAHRTGRILGTLLHRLPVVGAITIPYLVMLWMLMGISGKLIPVVVLWSAGMAAVLLWLLPKR